MLPEWLIKEEANSSDLAKQDLAECLLPMIEALPPHYREAVMASEIEGMTQKALAKKKDLSLSGAKSRVQRGRALLKTMLLGCCRIELNRGGRIIDYEKKDDACLRC